MVLTELPLGLRGKVYRSPMPFGGLDRQGQVLQAYKDRGISVVVLLADDEECLDRASCNLRERYLQEGLKVIYLPIRDGQVPTRQELLNALERTINCARSGSNVAIHCYAGVGRTGMFAACLARRVLGLSGKEAIHWIRQYIQGAVETEQQEQIVLSLE